MLGLWPALQLLTHESTTLSGGPLAALNRLLAAVMLALVNFYRRWFSPFLGPRCLFIPSCSASAWTRSSVMARGGAAGSRCAVCCAVIPSLLAAVTLSPTEMQRLWLYSRQGCCLCEGLEERLRSLDLAALDPPLQLEVIDIDAEGVDPGLKARYDLEVPVLALSVGARGSPPGCQATDCSPGYNAPVLLRLDRIRTTPLLVAG